MEKVEAEAADAQLDELIALNNAAPERQPDIIAESDRWLAEAEADRLH